AQLDPGFSEPQGPEEQLLQNRFWSSHLERLAAGDDPLLAELDRVGLHPDQLKPFFEELSENPDVDFPDLPVPSPDPAEVTAVRRELENLMDRAEALLPRQEPDKGWDKVQPRLRAARFDRWVLGWSEDLVFYASLARLCGKKYEPTQNRWSQAQQEKQAVKALCEEFESFGMTGESASRLLDQWYAHRYPIALRFARRAAEEFAEDRRRSGRLNFQDLLFFSARLLRTFPDARRELGERYRRVLVDEFQDTDPIQAELLLLLTSDPQTGDDWQTVVPRPGALFIVGDPKQSIYRFRRADISIYNLVRRRFAAFGDVLSLHANFRSGGAIADLVNEVFDAPQRFPPRATEHQAAFAPLLPQPPREPRVREGVFWYAVEAEANNRDAIAGEDAARIAAWVADRIQGGERSPGDFLLLTRTKQRLEVYARELEGRHVPVQVTGAGVGVEHELRELILLLEALLDPADEIRTVAVLVGLFFGLDQEQLLAHRLAGGSFRSAAAPDEPSGEVEQALATLGRWRRQARREAGDVFVARLVDELGLLPYAAAGELGAVRAGALGFVLDGIRAAALGGEVSLRDALEALRTAGDSEEAETPLQPGREDVVRLMNLHKAKGLEAPVVVLLEPAGHREWPPRRHFERLPDGRALGYLILEESADYSTTIHARPLEWPEKAEEELRFDRAEDDRLLYVAVTRAADELVVARNPGNEAKSPWGEFTPWLVEHGEELVLPSSAAPQPERLERSAEDIAAEVARVEATRAAAAEPSYAFTAVTALAKASAAAAEADPSVVPAAVSASGPPERSRGQAWGRVVHAALEAAGRGARGPRLRRICHSALLENERLTRAGEPVELDELLELVAAVTSSELWERAERAECRCYELPFTVRTDGGPGGESEEHLEGMIDLAFREEDGWVIVDYKTDSGSDPAFARRREGYRRQLEMYAESWKRLTGEPVKERLIFWTSGRRVERC
ncbi:MAG: UvrD-helicase domain-containing protein, partial [Longimicrobiaceae bacterium]